MLALPTGSFTLTREISLKNKPPGWTPPIKKASPLGRIIQEDEKLRGKPAEETWLCKYCGWEEENKAKMKSHWSNRHYTNPKSLQLKDTDEMYNCKACTETFKKRERLVEHYRQLEGHELEDLLKGGVDCWRWFNLNTNASRVMIEHCL